jgi:hypothetical protein
MAQFKTMSIKGPVNVKKYFALDVKDKTRAEINLFLAVLGFELRASCLLVLLPLEPLHQQQISFPATVF